MSEKKRSIPRRLVAGLIAVTVFVTGANAFKKDLAELFPPLRPTIETIFGDIELGREELDRIAFRISIGELTEAESLLAATKQAYVGVATYPKRIRLAELLVEIFAGPKKWDTFDEKGMKASLDELQMLPDHTLKQDAEVLLSYRIRNKNLALKNI